MSQPQPSLEQLLLAAWKCEQPNRAANGDIDRWAAKWCSEPGMWPRIALAALRFQQQGFTQQQLDLLVEQALAEYEARLASFVAQYSHLGQRARAAGTAANQARTQALLDEL